mmetsp:Transcript_45800/g.82431  ORF Transcript_45800/g.82431 Transcript_45800/m.82431 type:complete len:248 (+) Transcript_45800:1152-1895(+)
MNALDLDVDQGFLVDVQVDPLLEPCSKLCLGNPLHFHPLNVELRIILELQHALQKRHVTKPLMASKVLCEDGAECRVGAVHPAAWCHSIRHVDNLAHLAHVTAVPVELGERLLLNDLRVNGSNAIDLVGAHDCQVTHADLLDFSLFEDAQLCHHWSVAILGKQILAPSEIDLAKDLHVAWQHALHHLHWPLLQSLWHDRVISVVAAPAGDVPSFIPAHMHDVHKQPHHLWDSNGRVGVIHLHSHLLR